MNKAPEYVFLLVIRLNYLSNREFLLPKIGFT